MDRLLLPHLPAVLAVARTRSFARAAAELGLRPSAVSHAVRAAEERLGAPLFARTTRSVALTEAGDAFMESARRAFEELDAAVERVRAGQREVTGLLRINAPRVALQMGLTPVLLEMARRHPRLTTEIITDDALVDVVEGGFDAGIRLGEMIAQDMVVARLTPPCRAIMVASPSYVSVHGQPASIADLTQHNCIGFRLLASGAVYDWELWEDGKEVRAAVAGTVRVSDPTYARELALAGLGVAYVFEPLVHSDLAGGRLVELLPEAAITEPGLFLYFPRRAAGARKLRAFLDVIRSMQIGTSGNRLRRGTDEP
jgi:DNA-binding transcriptional LysR family regulator